jgi:predicted enzyme related to lactoylglutathione lyase
MKSTNYEIEGMTMAISHMDDMLEFYSGVFDIDFGEIDKYGSRLYSGQWGDLKLLFCPAEIARNTAKQNRHQFDVVVADLQDVIRSTRKHGGEVMGDIAEDNHSRSVGIYDPDRNSILFKEYKR